MAKSTVPPHKLSAASKAMVKKVLAFIRTHDNFLVSGHVRSDGDALGSQLAFHHLLKKLGKKSQVVCDHGALPDYRFLPGSEAVGSGPENLRKGYSAVFTFDSGSWERLERISAALPRKELTVVNVDHHASNERFGDINWVDPSFSACGEMVWELVKASGVKADKNIATCVYTTIVTDTGRFSFSNTTTETHLNAAELLSHGVRPGEIHAALFRQKTKEQLAFLAEVLRRIQLTDDGKVGWIVISKELSEKTGFPPGDTQEYIDQVKSIKGVRVAILLKETDEPGKVKVSWRTDAGINGITLASKYGGGGHPRASGATFRGTIGDAEKTIVDETVAFVKGSDRMKRPLRRHAEMEQLFGADFLPISKKGLPSAPPAPVPAKTPAAAPAAKAAVPAKKPTSTFPYEWETSWPADFQSFRTEVLDCRKCGLCSTRTQVVFGTGPISTPLMFVGEAPGEDEDRKGEPFVGRAGQLLTTTLKKFGIERSQVFIANILKCRPPGNRTPAPDEMAACMPWLQRQIATLQPKLICGLGNIAVQTLLVTKTGITKLRGRLTQAQGVPFFPTFHPAYILRNMSDLPLFEQDIRSALQIAGLLK